MKITCDYCGDSFLLPKEDLILYKDGFISCSDSNLRCCPDCWDLREGAVSPDQDYYSDADMGL